MPKYVAEDLKEVELSKQRVLCELADIGINPELIDYENMTLESLEMMLALVAEYLHKHPGDEKVVLTRINSVLAREAGKR